MPWQTVLQNVRPVATLAEMKSFAENFCFRETQKKNATFRAHETTAHFFFSFTQIQASVIIISEVDELNAKRNQHAATHDSRLRGGARAPCAPRQERV